MHEARGWCMLMCQDSKPRRCSFALPWSTVCHLARHKADSTVLFEIPSPHPLQLKLIPFSLAFLVNLQSFLGVLGVGGQWRCHGHQPSLIPWRGRRVRLAVLQLRLSGLVERGKKLEAPQAVGWWSSRGERDSQTVDNNDTAWLFTIRWSRLSLQELQRLRFRGVSLLFGVTSLDFRKIWHVERFLRVRHIIIKGSCLTALERCTCCCPGCEAESLGGCFSLEGLQPSPKGFPKSQGIGGVGSWVVESLARSGIGGSELQRFWVGWLVRRSSNWRNFTFFFFK